MSPTPRSVSSSHSHDRDRFSSQSKGSIASSGDDDVDSLLSIPVGSSEHSSTRRVGSLPNNRAPALSKKPSRTVASSSAPKRSFDLALRQMVIYYVHLKHTYLLFVRLVWENNGLAKD